MVRHLRERRGLSQRALSRAIGRSASYVTKLEAGEHEVSFGALSRIVLVLNVSPQELWVMSRWAAAEDAERDVVVTPPSYDLADTGS